MSHYSFSDKLLGVAAASNGKIYAIGGHNGNILSTVEEYDPATDTWTTRASMPTARYLLGVAAASNGKIYAIGGTLATVEEYDPATDTWTSRASMPTARGYLGVTAASNGKIYAIGGSVGMSPLATVEEYDPATDTWTTRASMPTARYGLGVAAASNGKIYAIGGPGPFVEEYDPATDTWTTRASMPTAQSALGVVAASNGKIYAIGGENGGGPLATVEEYDPAIDTWTTRTSMLTPMNNLGVAAANNGKIYAIGGTTVEEFTLPFVFNSSYNMEWLAPIVYSLDFDVTSLASRGIYTVTVYGAFDADGLEIAPNTAFTFTVDYAGFISDITPPLRSAVTASGDGSLSNLSASWISSDPESPIMMYRYAIGTTPGGRDVVNWNYISNTTTSMTRTGLNLTYGQVYYVTVGARNEGGLWSEDGASNGIIAGVVPPASFNKDTPANGGTGTSTSPTLSWTTSTGATSYEYCYDTTNDNACDSSWTSSGTATSANLSDLNINTTYYWHVRAINSGGTTYANSDIWWSFMTVPDAPAAFNKSAPANGSTDQPTSLTLSWATSSGATSYEYCYDTTDDNACSSWTDNRASTSKALSGLSNGTTYYWQVRANNVNGSTYSNGSSTAFWSFATVPSTPGASDKSAPLNGSTFISTSPILSWAASTGAISFEYCYDTTNDNACSSWISNGTSTSKALSGLSTSTTYYWHVRANNTGGTTYSNGSSTAFWSFTIIRVYNLFLPLILR